MASWTSFRSRGLGVGRTHRPPPYSESSLTLSYLELGQSIRCQVRVSPTDPNTPGEAKAT